MGLLRFSIIRENWWANKSVHSLENFRHRIYSFIHSFDKISQKHNYTKYRYETRESIVRVQAAGVLHSSKRRRSLRHFRERAYHQALVRQCSSQSTSKAYSELATVISVLYNDTVVDKGSSAGDDNSTPPVIAWVRKRRRGRENDRRRLHHLVLSEGCRNDREFSAM